jgi:thiosulfate/3-mercaptopyruvate sulfurtransferase
MRFRTAAVALIAITLFVMPAFPQSTTSLLVDAAWLSDHLKDPNLVVLHVGAKQEYDTDHIPGARHITDGDVTFNSGDQIYDLPEPTDLRTKLARFGISDDSRIVVYFGVNGGLPSATRVIFTLDYIGLGDRTSLLNGGLRAWKRAGKDVTSAVPPGTLGKLTSRPTKNIVADADLAKAAPQRSGFKLVDGRAGVFYKGIEASHEVSGHIAGAINIPFSDIADTDLMINVDRIGNLFRQAGVKPGETVVAYCHIGQQATAVLFAARLLGHPVMLYDGSIHDWAMVKHWPVEK